MHLSSSEAAEAAKESRALYKMLEREVTRQPRGSDFPYDGPMMLLLNLERYLSDLAAGGTTRTRQEYRDLVSVSAGRLYDVLRTVRNILTPSQNDRFDRYLASLQRILDAF